MRGALLSAGEMRCRGVVPHGGGVDERPCAAAERGGCEGSAVLIPNSTENSSKEMDHTNTAARGNSNYTLIRAG